MYFSDESSSKELLHFLFRCLISFGGKVHLLLFDWLEGEVSVKHVDHHLGIQFFHVLVAPSEYV